MKYLLIDGNNLAIRSAFANDYMANEDGVSSGAHYGFFNSLINLKTTFSDYQILVAWDSSSKRRREESLAGVELEIVPEAYKANRKKGETPQPLLDWFDTGHHLKNALGATGIPQIRVDGFEADDVIATYCQLSKSGHDIVIVTSDHDFYQLLNDQVIIWDGMKMDYITKSTFEEDSGITPIQHVDVGALMGDKGDNIFGIPGWGEKTALTAIKTQGSWESVIINLESRYGLLREEYPDFSDENRFVGPFCKNDRKKVFQSLVDEKTATEKAKYPQVYYGMPYSGLLQGFHEKKIKIPKKDLMALMFKDRVKLAYSLKSMDLDIPNLPDIEDSDKNMSKLLEYFKLYDIVSLIERVNVLFEEEECMSLN